jgi:cytochrome c biogenesis protein CcdA
MKKSFSFPYFIVKVGFTLLALYITAIFLMTNLPIYGRSYFDWFLGLAVVTWVLVFIVLAHETRLTTRFIGHFVKGLPPRWLRIIMDLLDRYTNMASSHVSLPCSGPKTWTRLLWLVRSNRRLSVKAS